jgi:CBS domain containing-hemolysin-like protein
LFIENILDLEERSAEQIMTPRNRIWAIPINAKLDEALKIINETTKTRYPVYEETLDQIIGILHIKDLARFIVHKIKDLNLRELVRPTISIPERLPLDDLLIRFRRENHQIAIVIDEFGGTAGIVTLEDLVEEVVGEIQDEFDEETLPIEELPGNTLRLRGDVLLAELEQHYNLDWKYPETNTIGGLVMSLLGEIAQPDDQVIYKGVKIVVESTEGLAVKSVLLFLPPKEKGTKNILG